MTTDPLDGGLLLREGNRFLSLWWLLGCERCWSAGSVWFVEFVTVLAEGSGGRVYLLNESRVCTEINRNCGM